MRKFLIAALVVVLAAPVLLRLALSTVLLPVDRTEYAYVTQFGRLLEGLQATARRDYGIELVDVRLRRHSYPLAVRQAIFDRIVSERNKKVAEYQSEGAQLAANIKSEAERDARYLLTEARAREQ